MTAAEILTAHEPEDVYTAGGAEYEGMECAYCTPRQLAAMFHDWPAFAAHLADLVDEEFNNREREAAEHADWMRDE